MVRGVDTRRIVERIKERAWAADQSWTPSTELPQELRPMRNHPALGYIHEHWALRRTMEPPPPPAGRAQPRESAKVAFRRWLFSAMVRYLDEEEELTANMVRLQDALAKRCDTIHEQHLDALESLRADLVDLAAHVEALLERQAPAPESGG